MSTLIAIRRARPDQALAIATIHIAARRAAMPYLPQLHADEEVRAWIAGMFDAEAPGLWVACHGEAVAGYMRLTGADLDDLYIHPDWQGQGIGSALLDEAKRLSPMRLDLMTFAANVRAREFYEARGFRLVGSTDGENEEALPDVQYLWEQT